MVTTLADLYTAFREFLYLPDPTVIDFTAALAVANRMEGDPVWGLLVGAPSSGKTEAIQSLSDLPEVYELSELNERTFLSGARPTQQVPVPSLLHQLDASGQTMLTLKEFGVLLSMRPEPRAQVLSQFRDIYDGSTHRNTGSGVRLEWTGRLGFLAGVTPDIDLHHGVIARLGDRWLYLRLPAMSDEERAEQAMRAALIDGQAMRKRVREAMTSYIDGLDTSRQPVPSRDVLQKLVHLAVLTTEARTGVARDTGGKRDILAAPEPEMPGRFMKQIVGLWRALVVMEHEQVGAVIQRVSLDSMPPSRSRALLLLSEGDVDFGVIRQVTRLSYSAAWRLMEDLEVLGLAHITKRGTRAQDGVAAVPHVWGLTSKGRKLWTAAFADIHAVLSTVEPSLNPSPEGEKGEVVGSTLDGATFREGSRRSIVVGGLFHGATVPRWYQEEELAT
jgi:hypothetical protein